MIHDENIGRRIGRYELREEIGRGGMATVYRALDTTLEREVALKLLHPYLTSHRESRTRFKREAQAVARLKHDSVLEIYDYSAEEQGDVFIVMELVQGTTLRRLLEEREGGPVPAEAAAMIMRPVCAALAHAHENGVVHRDVKPENILIGPGGEVKLSDFGIAHMAGMSQMTVTGQILGSPAYMSPEHVEMVELDARADIFSVGIILYEIAVGRPPFLGNNPHAVLKHIVEGKYDDPIRANPGIGHHLSQVIERCLQHDPKERFETASSLIDALDEALASTGCHSPKKDLKVFFANQNEWIETQKPVIVEHTLGLGLKARRKRRTQEAMNHFNRVLALDPGNESAIEAVAGMNRRRRTRVLLERVAVIIPAMIALSAVAWGLSRSVKETLPLPERHTAPKPPVVATPAPLEDAKPPPPAPAPAPVAEKTDAGTVEEQVVEPVKAVAKPPRLRKWHKAEEAPPALRKVVFTPHPLAVEIVIDDSLKFPFGPANRSRELPVGNHTISFIPNDTKRFIKQTWTVTIPEGAAPYQFRKRLQWRPATVRIASNIEAAVTIPGRVTDKSNREFKVAIENGPSEKLSVLISRDGYVPETKQLTINAGELTKLTVNLKRKNNSP